jgi:hypothetical protein
MTIKLKAMTNQKKCFLAVLIFSCAIYTTAKAQVYSIESFDGGNAKIKLNYTLFSKTLKVSCLNDTLFLSDYTGTREVHVLNKRFLQVTYETRGGTGSEVRSTLILSVNKHKITVSMLVTSYASWFSPDPENTNSIDKKGLYTLKFNMTGSDRNSYKLAIAIHDQLSSKLHPRTNYNKNEQVTLSFDPNQNIFYATRKNITQSFTVNDPKTQGSNKQQINGTLPVIALGKNNYYYIKGEWYGSGYSDNLFKGYYK